MTLAWEMLETARGLYQADGADKHAEALAGNAEGRL